MSCVIYDTKNWFGDGVRATSRVQTLDKEQTHHFLTDYGISMPFMNVMPHGKISVVGRFCLLNLFHDCAY